MKHTLRSRLIKWFSSRPNEVIASGDLQRMVAANTTYSPQNVGRRLRELVEDGYLTVSYKKNHAHYRWATQKNGYIGEFIGYKKVQLTLV